MKTALAKVRCTLIALVIFLPVVFDAAVAAEKTAAKKSVEKAISTPRIIVAAWIPEAPPVAKNNVAYLSLKNTGRPDVLLGISTPAARVAEMHTMSMAGGVMRMEHLPRINLRAHQELAFVPQGMHIMLIDMQRPLKVGERVPLTLQFKQAGKITVQAQVRVLAVDKTEPEDSHTHHHEH